MKKLIEWLARLFSAKCKTCGKWFFIETLRFGECPNCRLRREKV